MTEDETVGWHHLPEWVWVNSGSWWWTEKPCVLQSMGSQRVGYGWMTELTEAPLSMEFSRQEHWRGLPFPTPIIFHLLSNTLGTTVSYSLGYLSGFILITCLLQWVGLNLFLVSHSQPFSMGKRTQNTDILTNVLKYNSFLNFLSSLLENHLEDFFFFFFWVTTMGLQVKVCTMFLIICHEPKFKPSSSHLKNGNDNISLWIVIKITIP